MMVTAWVTSQRVAILNQREPFPILLTLYKIHTCCTSSPQPGAATLWITSHPGVSGITALRTMILIIYILPSISLFSWNIFSKVFSTLKIVYFYDWGEMSLSTFWYIILPVFCRYVYTQNVHLHIYVFNLLDSPSLCFPISAFHIMYMNF